jgi:Arc/MetJ-type ribon-helix-helix transcriptional regulator
MMSRLTVTIKEEQSELLEELPGEGGEYDSKSEAVRNFIQRGETIQELEERLEQREQRIEELQSQLSKRSQIEERIKALPDKLRESRLSYSEKKEIAISRASPLERWEWRPSGGVPEERVRSVTLKESREQPKKRETVSAARLDEE